METVDDYSILEEGDIRNCAMCGLHATVIAMETSEPLCFRCKQNNDEARRRK